MGNDVKAVKMAKGTIAAGFVGNILEWYDFAVYGYLATILGPLFFPSEDRIASLISTFGVFAAGYFVRPLGGAIFGHIGDKYGRKRALSLSILLMAIPTMLVGCLPTHETVGYWAAFLLVIMRLLQGLSVGGELTGSASFLVESAPPHKRGFAGSWSFFGAISGVLLGSAIGALITRFLSTEQMLLFGWRLPFIAGIFVGIAGFYLRRNMKEDKLFENLQKEDKLSKTPIKEFLNHHWKTALKILMYTWGFGVSFYLLFVFMPSFLHNFHNVDLHVALTTNSFAMLVLLACIPLMGIISDRTGRKPILLIAHLFLVICSFFLFHLIFKNTTFAIFGALAIFAIPVSISQAVLPVTMVEMFPTRVRYTGVSITYNLGMALFGGSTPVICTWLIKVTGGNIWAPVYYLVGANIIAVAMILLFKETYRKELV